LNLESLAALRAARHGREPDPVSAAVVADMAGISGVVCPYRNERGALRQRDLELLKTVVNSHFNCVVHADADRLGPALKVMPDMVTLADLDGDGLEIGSLDVITHEAELSALVQQLRDSEIIVTLVIDPELEAVKIAARTGADYVQLNTTLYGTAPDANQEQAELDRLAGMAVAAAKLGMSVMAGGHLHYRNMAEVAGIDAVEELNAGHALVSRAVLIGMERAVRDMLRLLA